MRFIRLLGAVVVFYGLSYLFHALLQILSLMRYRVFKPIPLHQLIIGLNLTIGIVTLVIGVGLLLARKWARAAWLVTVIILVLLHNLILLITFLAGQDLTQQLLNILLIFFLAVLSWTKLGDEAGKQHFR